VLLVLTSGRGDGREDPTVGTGSGAVEGQRIEGSFGPLKAILAARTFVGIGRCRRAPIRRLGQ
jgi:hypothetical protein